MIIPCISNHLNFSDFEKDGAKDLKQSDTCGLAHELKIGIGASVVLMTNTDIQDRLIND